MNIAHNVNDLLVLAGSLAKSGLMPNGLTKPEAILAIALKGQELGIGPMAAIAGITVIQGKPVVSPQLMLSLVERSGKLEDWKVIEESDQQVVVQFTRKGRTPIQKGFSMKDAQQMGLATKDNWKKQPRTMMQWRAISAAVRLAFPDVIDGCYTAEELGVDMEVDAEGAMQVASVVQESPPQLQQGVGGGKFSEARTEPPAFRPTAPSGMSAETKKTLLAMAEKAGYATKSGGKGMNLKDFIERVIDRTIGSFAEVTEAEGQACIDSLSGFVAAIEEMGGKKVAGTVQKGILE